MRSFLHKIIFFIAPGLFCGGLYAQQDPQFSQYFFNQFVYNPAYAGVDNALSATAHLRTQWTGISGHPVIQNISVHTPVSLLHGGTGLQILNEQEGAMRVTSVSLAYSFIHTSRIGKFSLGVNGGIIQSSLDGTKLRASDGVYQNSLIEHNDPVLPVVIENGLGPDFAAGLFFSSSKLNLGISVTHIVPMAIKFNQGTENLGLDMVRQYYLQASYLAKVGKSFAVRPAVFAKSNGHNIQGEGDVILSYNEFIWFGGGYRGYSSSTQDAIVGIAGINIGENLKIGYSYDYTVSALKAVSDGSHEIVLNYRVSLVRPAKPGKAIYNPRF